METSVVLTVLNRIVFLTRNSYFNHSNDWLAMKNNYHKKRKIMIFFHFLIVMFPKFIFICSRAEIKTHRYKK